MAEREESFKKKTREELLKKLRKDYEESETLQWFIEVELLRLQSNGNLTYQELRNLARLSDIRISNSSKKKD